MRAMLMLVAVMMLDSSAGALGGRLGGGRGLPEPAAVVGAVAATVPVREQTPAAPLLPTPEQATAISFISDAVKRAEADTFVNLSGQKGAAVYVPLRVLDWPIANISDVGLGGAGGLGKPEGIVSARINVPQLANAVFGTRWFAANSHGPVLPSFFLGPAIKAAWPPSSFRWDREVLFLLGLPLGSIGGSK